MIVKADDRYSYRLALKGLYNVCFRYESNKLDEIEVSNI
jgi:hypothetical protein